MQVLGGIPSVEIILQYRAITDCDTTSFFYRIEKINPVLEKLSCLKFN